MTYVWLNLKIIKFYLTNLTHSICNQAIYWAKDPYLVKLSAKILLNISWLVEKGLFEHKWILDLIQLLLFMQNGRNLRQLLFRPLINFGGKVRQIFWTQTFSFDQILYHFVFLSHLCLKSFALHRFRCNLFTWLV